ncbi:BCCT family transporter [Corynebacterium lubricantis]|uniref:BCCT family transporter n=1 Tax=Corynebacterium lubricantis TaxID=541095 RepID=UPI00037D1035|nr:BCCT family transporter [Corynebacterium lubricantis]
MEEKESEKNLENVQPSYQGPHLEKDYVSVDETLSNRSATEELAAILERQTSGEGVEVSEQRPVLEFENKNAPINWKIVVPTVVIVFAVVVWALFWPDEFANFASESMTALLNNFGWAFVFFGSVYVAFILIVALSRFGRIRLGSDDERPEFRTVSWIAMMFAAGMGIGLMFYGAMEPLTHYREGVPGREPNDVGAAMANSMFHWTLHPWALYAVVGLAIGYSTYRLGRKQLISAAFVPLIGQRAADGWPGRIIDIFAIFATIFGTAVSLGIGAMQIGAGLVAAGFIENVTQWLLIGIIVVLSLAFMASAVSGVGKGIQYLSNFNIILAAILAILVFAVGPTVSILNLIPGSFAAYFDQFFEMAGRTAMSADGTAGEWLSGWTIFYWVWWSSWSPFVGMFLARISRGRTVREFCLGVLVVPSAVSVVWFSIMGGSAIVFEQNGRSVWGDGNPENILFNLLYELPGGSIMAIAAVILLGTFFITSADSASTVMGSMSQNGRSDANPWLSAMWGALTAVVALILLIPSSDALSNLQNVTIVATSPFILILIGLMVSTLLAMRIDVNYQDYREQQRFAAQLARERRAFKELERIEALEARRNERIARKQRKTKR